MGIWVESDGFVPSPADAVLYDWDDSGSGDNKGNPDHVGVVETVNKAAGTFSVIEGNYSNAVKRRTLKINGKYIRGFITPKYDTDGTESNTTSVKKSITKIAKEVLAGKWENGEQRKSALKAAGYDYESVQKKVNELSGKTNSTAPSVSRPKVPSYTVGKNYTLQVELKVRKGAGTNYAAKKNSELTANAKANDSDKDGALNKGTVVTCKAIKKVGNDIWMEIPSGWIAAYYDGEIYVK